MHTQDSITTNATALWLSMQSNVQYASEGKFKLHYDRNGQVNMQT